MKKDELTDTEVIDYDFLGKKLYPPKKMKTTDAGKEFAKLFRELDRFYYPGKKSKKEFHARPANAHKQPCTVKMYYTATKEQHKEFLRNYMPQNNKKEVADKPRLFNGIYDEVPEEEILNYEKNMVDLGFKFILSPESQQIPMKELVRQFVGDLERVSGHKFTWLSAVHTDTNHIHAHLLINGADARTKKEIRFPPNLVKDVARHIGSDICTGLIGTRTGEQIELARQKLPYAKRWTKLDDRIIGSGGYFEFDGIKTIGGNEFEAEKIPADNSEIQRLNTLADMGLAMVFSKNNPPKYYLEKGWKEKLRAVGRYNTYLDARSNLRFTPFYNLEMYDGTMGQIDGIVSRIYNMDDEYIWNNAVVIENKKLNRAWYVPIRIKLQEEDLGKVITVRAEKNQKGKLRPLVIIHSR